MNLLRSQPVDTAFSSSEIRNEPESYELWLGAGYSTGLDRSDKVLGIQEYMLSFGGYTGKARWLQFNGSYLHSPILKTSDPAISIEDGISMMILGMELKSYTPSTYSFLGHYFSEGAGVVFAYWNYTLENIEFDLPDSFDSIWGCDLHLGTGFILGRLLPLSINLDVTPGVILWLSDSHQDFTNSILPVYYYLKVRVTLNCSIASW